MEQPRNGGGKVVTFHDAMQRNGSVSRYLDIGRDPDAGGRATARPLGSASRRRTYADGELDVFSAERYFKGALMDGSKKDGGGVAVLVPPAPPLEMAAAAASSARPVVSVGNKPAGTKRASSVASSSATSANSRTTLLRRGGGQQRDRKCCVQVGALVMRTCSGKRSVRVDAGEANKKEVQFPGTTAGVEPAAASSKIDWYRELRMQKAALGVAGAGDVVAASAALPPNLNHLGTAKVAAIGRDQVVLVPEDKPAELFISSSSSTLLAPIKANNVPANGSDEREDDDDDGGGSESSSDLFEIKSLMIDECPYEPSEASIQWSVATADASERGGDRVSARWLTTAGGGGNSHRGRGPVAGTRQSRDHRPAALLAGCVSHRAVEVSNAPRRGRGEGLHKSGA